MNFRNTIADSKITKFRSVSHMRYAAALPLEIWEALPPSLTHITFMADISFALAPYDPSKHVVDDFLPVEYHAIWYSIRQNGMMKTLNALDALWERKFLHLQEVHLGNVRIRGRGAWKTYPVLPFDADAAAIVFKVLAVTVRRKLLIIS